MHYEYGRDYSYARAAIATSGDIEKPLHSSKAFVRLGTCPAIVRFTKMMMEVRILSSARENYDMMLYKLTDDYTDVKTQIATLWPGGHREAPALVKRGKITTSWMTSGCTGWAPNQAMYAFSKSISGPWSELKNIANSTTFDSQSTFILKLVTKQLVTFMLVTVGMENSILNPAIFTFDFEKR